MHRTGTNVSDQITTDLISAGAKSAPAVIGSAYSAAQGWALADVAVLMTIVYTGALLATLTVKNWGLWMDWWAARGADVRRLWAWMRRRG